MLTLEDVMGRLRAAVKEDGGQAPFARRTGVSTSYVSAVLTGARSPGPTVLASVGLEACEPAYRPVRRAA